MATAELTVLWVDIMKLVGGSISSPSRHIADRKFSVLSMQPSPVPVNIPSGHSIPASFKAAMETATARLRIKPIRRACIGFRNVPKSGSWLLRYGSSKATGTVIQSSQRGFWTEICDAERM